MVTSPGLVQDSTVPLSRQEIIVALERLNDELMRADAKASVYLVGGAVMCIVLNARESTKDVDAWFSDPSAVRSAARRVAIDLSLPEDWLNDAAKGFVPESAGFDSWRALSNLEILVADEQTLFAMKCAAARTEEDAADIRLLAERLGISSSTEALQAVLRYYPENRLPVRTRLLLEELLDDGH